MAIFLSHPKLALGRCISVFEPDGCLADIQRHRANLNFTVSVQLRDVVDTENRNGRCYGML